MNMNGFASREKAEERKKMYPAGCRIVMDGMDSPYQTVPAGTQGTVVGVDDRGFIHAVWDHDGSPREVRIGDRCHKISTEAEAKTTLDFYGKRQPEEEARCPRCGDMMFGKRDVHALSRWAAVTICGQCMAEEKLKGAGAKEIQPLMDWAAIVVPQCGGGRWKR